MHHGRLLSIVNVQSTSRREQETAVGIPARLPPEEPYRRLRLRTQEKPKWTAKQHGKFTGSRSALGFGKKNCPVGNNQ